MKKIFFILSVLFTPVILFAHASPVAYIPSAGEPLSYSPKEVSIVFSEHLEPSASSMKVFSEKGGIKILPALVNPDDTHMLTGQFLDNKDGVYTVSWQVVSADDGHFTKGAYNIIVGSSTGTAIVPPAMTIVHSSGKFEATTIWFKLVGESLFIGLFAFLVLFRKIFSSRAPDIKERIYARSKYFFLVAGAILLLGTLAYVIFKTSTLGALEETTFVKAFLAYMVTTGGTLSLGLLFVLPCFMIVTWPLVKAFIFGEKTSFSRIIVSVLFFLFMSYTQARLSHAAASEFMPTFSVLVNCFHLFGKGLWIGSIIALWAVFLPAIGSRDISLRKLFSINLGKLVALALVLGGISGVWIVWLHLKDISNIFTTDWGHILLLLGFFAGILFVLRMLSCFIFERMRRCVPCESSSLFLEVLVGLTVSFFSALIIITTPPLFQGTPWSTMSHKSGIMMTLTEDRARTDTLLLATYDEKGSPIDGAPLLSFTNKSENIGPLPVASTKYSLGIYGIDGKNFTPHGVWDIEVTIPRSGHYDALGSFALDYPKAVEDTQAFNAKRHIGNFERAAILVVALMLVAAGLLCWLMHRREQLVALADDEPLPPSVPFPFAYGVALLSFLLFIGVGMLIDRMFFTPKFQKLCEKENGHWHQMVPIEQGRALSAIAQNGCSMETPKGIDHFVKQEEFEYALGQNSTIIPMKMEGAEHMHH